MVWLGQLSVWSLERIVPFPNPFRDDAWNPLYIFLGNLLFSTVFLKDITNPLGWFTFRRKQHARYTSTVDNTAGKQETWTWYRNHDFDVKTVMLGINHRSRWSLAQKYGYHCLESVLLDFKVRGYVSKTDICSLQILWDQQISNWLAVVFCILRRQNSKKREETNHRKPINLFRPIKLPDAN